MALLGLNFNWKLPIVMAVLLTIGGCSVGFCAGGFVGYQIGAGGQAIPTPTPTPNGLLP